MPKAYITKNTIVIGNFAYKPDGKMYDVMHVPSRVPIARFYTDLEARKFIQEVMKIDTEKIHLREWIDWDPVRAAKVLDIIFKTFKDKPKTKGTTK